MIKVICIGKLKENYLKEAEEEYLKRLKKYTNIELIELQDSNIDDEKIALEKEKELVEKQLTGKEYLVTLEIEGKELSSIELAEKLDKTFITNSNITFLLEGSYEINLVIN